MLPGAVWSREKSSTALVRAKSKSWATTTIIGALLCSVRLLGIRDPVSWEGFSLPTRYALQLEKRPPRISKWKCLLMLLKPVSLGCLVGTNHSSRPPSRLCVSTTFQPPRTFRILSYRYSPLHRRDVYTLCFILLCCFLLFVYRLPCFQAVVNHCSSDSGSRIQPTSSAPRGSPIPGAGAVRGTLSQMRRPLRISQLRCRMDWVNILQQEVGR